MAFDYETESFTFGGEMLKRLRPKKVSGPISVLAPMADDRDMKVQPIALYPAGNTSGTPDLAPHNTEGGHLIGLENLGGDHAAKNLVPMYGNFNKSKYKTDLENVLIKEVQGTQGVTGADVVLDVHYDLTGNRDPRIPTGFTYTLTVKGSVPKVVSKTVAHPLPSLRYVSPPGGFSEYLHLAYQFMEHDKWFIEDHFKNYAWSTGNTLSGLPLNVPDRNLSARPYAVIDYILYGSKEQEREKFISFIKSFDLDRLNEIGNQFRPELVNGWDFSEDQKKIVRAVNVVMYKGFIKSDCLDDYVYEGAKLEVYKSTKYTTEVVKQMQTVVSGDRKSYNIVNNSSPAPEGTLSFDGSHQFPEVDHIRPQTHKSMDFGCNAYSNAMVVSMFYNNQMRTKLKKVDMQTM